LPAPNRSPTTFMPSMRGPSMTLRGEGYLPDARASSVSAASGAGGRAACRRVGAHCGLGARWCTRVVHAVRAGVGGLC